MQRIALILFLIGMPFVSSCSVNLKKNHEPSSRLQQMPRLDPNAEPKFRVITDSNTINCLFLSHSQIETADPSWIPYNNFYFDLLNMIVVKTSLPNGKNYWVLIDTGSEAAFTNSLTIIENGYRTYPFTYKSKQLPMGVTCIPELQINGTRFVNIPALYLDRYWQVTILGLPVWKQAGFLLGLEILSQFSYIEFNNPGRALKLVMDGEFHPADPNSWDNFKFELKRDITKFMRIFVRMPVGNSVREVEFDTCGRDWLIVDQNCWNDLSPALKGGKLRDSKFTSGFLGNLPCRRATVRNFRLANQIVRNDEIIVVPENSPFPPNIVGPKYFKNTEFVIDFKNHFLWIKK